MASHEHSDYPLLAARSGRFRFGAPRSFSPTADGRGIAFIRSRDGLTAAGDLWWLDLGVPGGQEQLLLASDDVLTAHAEDLPPAERARRERMREGSMGITTYSMDSSGTCVVFAMSGKLFRFDLPPDIGRLVELEVPGPVVDPRISPDGLLVAWHAEGRLWLSPTDIADPHPLTPDDGGSWGLADFVAAEELERIRGFWWAPDSASLLVERVDDDAVAQWWISDPAWPDAPPRPVRYPAAGTTNARLELWHVCLDGNATRLLELGPGNDHEYLATVEWSDRGAVALTLDRSQRNAVIHRFSRPSESIPTRQQPTANAPAKPTRAAAAPSAELVAVASRALADSDWIDIVHGVPTIAPDGALVTVERDLERDRMRVHIDGHPIGPDELQVRSVIEARPEGVLATVATNHERSDLVLIGRDGSLRTLVDDGWVLAVARGDLIVVTSTTVHDRAWRTRVFALTDDDLRELATVASFTEDPPVTPSPRFSRCGGIPYAVLLPEDPVSGPLPILMTPYGGPHAQRVMSAGPAMLESQWLANQGFAVVIADGRGTPGISPSWERQISGDLATGVLADQVSVLDEVISELGDLVDGSRVGIMGWSFGGYLSALAVLARPDRFHAAVAGAPVTDWRIYDTAYTERYLGDPHVDAGPYELSDLIRRAPDLCRPLMLVHGMVDDNVVAAHTLRLSSALLAAGKPHSVLPLTGVSHMTPQPVVSANLLRLQCDFLCEHLQVTG